MPTARELLEQADALMRRNRSSAGDDIPVLTDSVSPTRDLRVSLRPPPPQPPAAPSPDSIPTLTEHVAPDPVEAGDSMLREGEPSDWLEFEAGEPSVTGNAPDSIAIVPSVLPERSDDEALIESAEHEEIELTAPVEDDFEREMAPFAVAPAAPFASVPPIAPTESSTPPAAVSATALAATFAPVLPSTTADTDGALAPSPAATLDEAIDEPQDAMGDESAPPAVDDEWDVPLAADRDVPTAKWDAPVSTWDAPAAKGDDVVADEEWAEPAPAELGEPAGAELEESPAAAPGTEFDEWMGEAESTASAAPATREFDDAPTAETAALPDEPVAVSSAAITPEPIGAIASWPVPAPIPEAGVVADGPATPSGSAATNDAPDAGRVQASAAAPAPAVAMAADQARWDVVAEEIRMQVLQRIDLFTDTGLREQLGRRLQPIVDRASADLVSTINQHVGELLRAYVAEALEREIENWRKNN